MKTDILEKIKIDLLMERPFFGTILSGLQIVWDETFSTAATNGRDIRINPGFWEGLTFSQQLSLLAHEALHVGLCHHVRIKDRDYAIWNIAADMAINPLLTESGFELPKGSLFDHVSPSRSAEEIYAELISSAEYAKCTAPGWGEVRLVPYDVDVDEEEVRVQTVLVQASRIAGPLPQGLDRMVKEIISPPVAWDIILSDFVRQSATEDYSHRKYANKHVHRGFYLPSLQSPYLDVVIVLDTSGSISKEDLSKFTTAIEDVRTTYPTTITLLYCDAKVYVGGEFRPEDSVKFQCRGGGGTDFRPPFKWIENNMENLPNCVVYLTDGQCDSYPPPQPFPIVWVVVDGDNWTVSVE